MPIGPPEGQDWRGRLLQPPPSQVSVSESCKVEKDDLFLIQYPAHVSQEVIEGTIDSFRQAFETHFGWTPLLLGMPDDWSMGKLSREEAISILQEMVERLRNE